MKPILARVEELYKKIEEIRLTPNPNGRELSPAVKQAVALCLADYGHDVMEFERQEYEKKAAADPKLQEMRLECLKLASYTKPLVNNGAQIDAHQITVAADIFFRYLQGGKVEDGAKIDSVLIDWVFLRGNYPI